MTAPPESLALMMDRLVDKIAALDTSEAAEPTTRDRYYSRRAENTHERYQEILSCPICLELFVDPHILGPCGHTVCGPCFFVWEGSTSAAPKCPECNQQVQHAAKNNTVQENVYDLVYSRTKNHEYKWQPLTYTQPIGKDRKAWEVRRRAWATVYTTIPQKSLQIDDTCASEQPPGAW